MSEPTQPLELPKELYARCLFYAGADLNMADRAMQPPALWHEACFLAREGAEKSLKSFLEAAGKVAPTLHSLNALLRECIAVDKEFGRFQSHCQRLARYQDTGRYPPVTDAYTFTEEIATEAVRLARELFDTVRDKIEKRKQAGLL